MNIDKKGIRSAMRTKSQQSIAILASLSVFVMPAAAAFAHTPDQTEIVSEAAPSLSAYEAKRLARAHLCDAGFCSSFGPGAAKLSAITRDAGIWILNVRLSGGGATFTQHRVLYIDAGTGVVSEVPPAASPTQVASE